MDAILFVSVTVALLGHAAVEAAIFQWLRRIAGVPAPNVCWATLVAAMNLAAIFAITSGDYSTAPGWYTKGILVFWNVLPAHWWTGFVSIFVWMLGVLLTVKVVLRRIGGRARTSSSGRPGVLDAGIERLLGARVSRLESTLVHHFVAIVALWLASVVIPRFFESETIKELFEKISAIEGAERSANVWIYLWLPFYLTIVLSVGGLLSRVPFESESPPTECIPGSDRTPTES